MFASLSAPKLDDIELLVREPSRPPTPKFVTKSYKVQIPKNELVTSTKNDDLRSSLDTIALHIERISVNQHLLQRNLETLSALLKNKPDPNEEPLQRFLARKLDRLTCRICCTLTISLFTLLGGVTVISLMLVIIYRYMT